VAFKADYDEIKLKNIVMTSFQWPHHHYVTKKRHQNNVTNFFPIWLPPNQNFWLHQWSWVNNLMVFKKSGLGLGFGLEKVILVLVLKNYVVLLHHYAMVKCESPISI